MFSLRTASSIHREAATTVTIDGIIIPKGTQVIIVPAVTHFRSDIWGANAESFDPDRWDNLSTSAADPYAFEPFISGPRMCIGRSFAMLEFKVLLAEIVRKFKFESIGEDVKTVNEITLKPAGGLRTRISALGKKAA
jgi:cytochrome P450